MKQAISIIKHSFTVSLGGSNDFEKNLDDYLKDFETKVNQGTKAVQKVRNVPTTEEMLPDELEATDKYRQKSWKKFLEFAEGGYLPPDGSYWSPDGKRITIRTNSGEPLPFNRTRQERPKIRDLSVDKEQ